MDGVRNCYTWPSDPRWNLHRYSLWACRHYPCSRLRFNDRGASHWNSVYVCSFAFINWGKRFFPIDDPLDAFGCHGIAGICGSILTGVFATRTVNPHIPVSGLLYGGGWHLLGVQAFGTVATIIFVTIMASGIALLLARFIPMRVSKQAEQRGLDQSEHGERVDYTVQSKYDVRRYQDEFRGQLGQLYHHKKL